MINYTKHKFGAQIIQHIQDKVLYRHQDPVQHQQFSLDAIPLKSQSQLPCPQIPDICTNNKKIQR